MQYVNTGYKFKLTVVDFYKSYAFKLGIYFDVL